jgi:ketosteroid isomerase-like protein
LATREPAAVSDISDEIARVEEELRRAMLAGDVETLDRFISDRLLFAGPDGQLATKADDLHAHRERIIRFLRHEPDQVEMRRVSEDSVVVSQRTYLEVEVAGTVHRGRYRYTRVWVREGDAWRILAGQVSAVAGS